MIRPLFTLLALLPALVSHAQSTQVRVLEQNTQGAVIEVIAAWEQPFDRSLLVSGTLSEDALVRAVEGSFLVSKTLPLPSLDVPGVEILAAEFDELPVPGSLEVSPLVQALLDDEVANVGAVGLERRKPMGTFTTRLLHYDAERRVVRRYRRLLARVRFASASTPSYLTAATSRVTQSVLADGQWFKVPVTEEGMYRIDRTFIRDVLGLEPNTTDPNAVRVFGNGGEMLPALVGADRPQDLVENPSLVRGGGDGRFDEGDYVLFFGKGPSGWRWQQPEDHWTARFSRGTDYEWQHYLHLFSTANVYFVRIGGSGPRITPTSFSDAGNATVLNTFEARHFVETDRENLGADGGSGLDWMGDRLDVDFPTLKVLETTFPGQQAGEVRFQGRVAVRSNPSAAVRLDVNGAEVARYRPGTVALSGRGSNESWYALPDVQEGSYTASAGAAITAQFVLESTSSSAQVWFDWLEVYYPRAFAAQQDYLRFHTPAEAGTFEMALTGFTAAPQVWDVTQPGSVRRLGVQQQGAAWRVQTTVADPLVPRELVAFVPGAPTERTLSSAEPIANQNLRGLPSNPDFVIVTPEAFRTAADALAEHRRAEGLSVAVMEVAKVYNEFSGGVPDMRAVRDMLRHFYAAPNSALRYVLLLGDGHVDLRGLNQAEGGQRNWVLPYESDVTLHQGETYTTDDYFGLLDENEGVWPWISLSSSSSERLDLGIGRFTVQTAAEANAIVAKIKHYESPATQGSWRSRYTFIADDNVSGSVSDENNLHTMNADIVADVVQDLYPQVDVQKIYAVSYPAEQTTAGRRVPEAHDAIQRAVEEGTLVWNYSGHGGWKALADERLVTLEDIAAHQNYDRLSIFVTATCSFGHWDMPDKQSGAELLLLNPSGGAIAVFTTVRLVFTPISRSFTLNVGLNKELNRYMLELDTEGMPRRLGDVMQLTKATAVGAQANNRKFNLLGDPTLRVGLPKRPVRVTRVNGTAPQPDAPVPLKALDRVTVAGEVLDPQGNVDRAYDGTVEVTVFDAARGIKLEDPVHFSAQGGKYFVQNDLIFRGQTTAQGGRFDVEFVVPKDISYANARGKISVYAMNANTDGYGATSDVIVGGTSDNPVQDSEGPQIQAFLNDTTFVSGGLTEATPTLIVKLADESGINTVGTGVGHEMLLVIDGDEENAVNLSSGFEGELGGSRKGTVRYQLPEMAPGSHTLSVKAWDVVNNSGETMLEFDVAASADLHLDNVYTYPNPTSGPADFVFEHNQAPGTTARVQVRIYTVSGRPVRTMEATETLPGGALTSSVWRMAWDGRDEEGDELATGIYLYRVRVDVEQPGGERQVAEHIEKIAIIR